MCIYGVRFWPKAVGRYRSGWLCADHSHWRTDQIGGAGNFPTVSRGMVERNMRAMDRVDPDHEAVLMAETT